MLEEVVAKEPERFEAHVNLASAYLKRNELAKARAEADRALALSPTLGRAHETRGLVLWRGGDEAGAAQAFRTALRWDPGSVRANVWLGMVEMNQQEPGRRARELRPRDAARSDARRRVGRRRQRDDGAR